MRLPLAHQYQGYVWARENPRGLILSEMRTGKSYIALMSVKGEGPGIILCPASAKLIWRDEVLIVFPNAKIDIVKTRSHIFMPDADVYIINYDILPDNFVNLPRHVKYSAWSIIDEFHRLKNPAARRTGAARAIIRNARICHPLSGTPMPSRPIEWWSVLEAIGIISSDWLTFAYRYAAAWPAPWAKDNYGGVDVRGASNTDELRAILAPHVIRHTKAQVIKGYIDPQVKLICFDRPKAIQESAFSIEHIQQFDNPLVSIDGLAEVIKQTAIERLPDCIEFIEDRLREEQKIIVFAWNKDVIAMLESSLAEYPSVTITGETSQTKREYARTAFQGDPSIRLLFGNILSAGESLNLSAADVSIFVQITWVPAHLQQAVQRTESMAKIGKQSVAYVLTTANSIDHYMVNSLFKKLGVIDSILPMATPPLTHP